MLLNLFTEENIVKIIATWRVRQAKNRHNNHFLHRIASVSNERNPTNSTKDVDKYCPPRNKWLRPSLKKRMAAKDGDVNLLALRMTLSRDLKDSNQQNEPYVINLKQLVANIRWRVSNAEDLTIKSPEILPLTKNSKGPNGVEYFRPLSLFEIEDRIILNLTARYLSEKFDVLFSPSSYAFRRKCRRNKIPTHHDAVIDLLKYKRKNNGRPLYVAEMDIQSFFDCVSHSVALDQFQFFKEELAKKHVNIDPTASHIYKCYLACYNFPMALEQANLYFQANKINGELKWPKKDLAQWFYKKDFPADKIGIPQGGAISPLIANMVLHDCDLAVAAQSRKNNFFYARYCDDMVVISREKKKTARLLKAYQNTLFSKKLLYHKPKLLSKYIGTKKKEFWESKSKKTYTWGPRSYPWVSFLGYQIRHDELLRVRKNSIEKEIKKQRAETEKVVKHIRERIITKTRRSVLFRLRTRLIAMSVGKLRISNGKWERSSYSWINGFKIFGKNRSVALTQLRNLDRFRNRRLNEIRKLLEKLDAPSKNPHRLPAPERGQGKDYAESYCAQIKEFKGYVS